MTGTSTIVAPGCGINIKGNFSGSGGAAIARIDLRGPSGDGTMNVGGTVTPSAWATDDVHLRPRPNICGAACAALITDPLSALPTPSNPGGCTPINYSGGTHTIVPGCYNGISISNSTVTFAGVAGQVFYIASGNFSISGGGSVVTGADVTIYQAGTGTVTMPGGSVTLRAPLTGPYAGILFYQNRTSTATAAFNGGASVSLTGTLYFRDAQINYTGGSTIPADYTLFVSRRLSLTGPTTFSNNIPFIPGNPLTGSSAGIVE